MDFSVSFLENLYESESTGKDVAEAVDTTVSPGKAARSSPRKTAQAEAAVATNLSHASLRMTPSPKKRKRTLSASNSPPSTAGLTKDDKDTTTTPLRRSPRKQPTLSTPPSQRFGAGESPSLRRYDSIITKDKAMRLDLSSMADESHPSNVPVGRDGAAQQVAPSSPTESLEPTDDASPTKHGDGAAPTSPTPSAGALYPPESTKESPNSPESAQLGPAPPVEECQVSLTGQQVHCVRHVVLSQRSTAAWTGLDGAIDDVRRVLERTVVYGENHSAMVVGSAGSGKRDVVRRALAALTTTQRGFHTVFLSGSVLTNDMEAFREIIQQLVPDGGIVGHKAVSFFNMYDFLKQLLLEKALAGVGVVFVLDAFDAFVGGAKQLLVYNLLDWMQSKDVRMALVGMSCNYNVLALFEKRVKSRFSNIQIAVPRPPLKAILQLLWTSLQFPRRPANDAQHTDGTAHTRPVAWPAHVPPPPDDFPDLWEAALHRVLFGTDPHATWWWQYLYDLGKPIDVFVRLVHVAVGHLNPSSPLLCNAHVQAAWDVLFPPHVLHALRGLTTREMTLVLGMIGLERQGKGQYSFEMVLHECKAFFRQHALKTPPRAELLNALANLLDLHVVQEVSHQPQPEFCMVRLGVRPTEVLDAIRTKTVSCTAVVEQWAINILL